MKNKIINLLLIFICVFSLFSCKGKNKVTSISVLEDSIPEIYEGEIENKIGQIKMNVIHKDDSVEVVNLSKSMISEIEYSKLSLAGTYTITVNYEGQSDTFAITILATANNNYTVKVLYPNNTPVKDILVQWCSGSNCFLPVVTNSDGVAEIELEDGNYFVHIEDIPEGYTYDPNAYTTTTDNKSIEIKLLAMSNITSGDGSSDSPYVVSNGVYKVTFELQGNKGMKYFNFTPSESGTYTITSIAMDKLAINAIDPYIAFGENFDDSGNTQNNINFSHSFVANAGVTYSFVILVSSATSYPASFEIIISK